MSAAASIVNIGCNGKKISFHSIDCAKGNTKNGLEYIEMMEFEQIHD
jgi:hypothetical protein